MCSFWLIKQVVKSIEPPLAILGNGCNSSQHQRTSRTNSTQRIAIADPQIKALYKVFNDKLTEIKLNYTRVKFFLI